MKKKDYNISFLEFNSCWSVACHQGIVAIKAYKKMAIQNLTWKGYLQKQQALADLEQKWSRYSSWNVNKPTYHWEQMFRILSYGRAAEAAKDAENYNRMICWLRRVRLMLNNDSRGYTMWPLFLGEKHMVKQRWLRVVFVLLLLLGLAICLPHFSQSIFLFTNRNICWSCRSMKFGRINIWLSFYRILISTMPLTPLMDSPFSFGTLEVALVFIAALHDWVL